jgi:predicted ArsR family transcriptional regulator
MTPLLEQDPCAPRHGNDAESLAAHRRVNSLTDRKEILALIERSGERGLTLDETASILSRSPNQISGRFSELRMKGAIRATEQRRKTRSGANAKVYQAI